MRIYLLVSFTMISFISSIKGQISITDQDLLGLIGSSFIFETDTSETFEVDHGSAGDNQFWDFSLPLDNSFTLEREFLDPFQTDFGINFASANLAEKITSPDFADGAIYNYYEISPNRAVEVGNATVVEVMGTTFEDISQDFHLVAPLPFSTGSSWTETLKDTTVEVGAFTNILFDSTVVMVDGWGKINLPGGEYDCLRLFEQCWTRTQTVINDVIIDTSSESALSYIWVGKNNFILASVTSLDGETDPGFTTASSFSRLGGGTSPSKDFNHLNQNLQVIGPNPFADNLYLEVDFDQAKDVHLAVYDLKGAKVKTLLQTSEIDGLHRFNWDGEDGRSHLVSAGTYLVSLQTNKGRAIRKVQLLH